MMDFLTFVAQYSSATVPFSTMAILYFILQQRNDVAKIAMTIKSIELALQRHDHDLDTLWQRASPGVRRSPILFEEQSND